MHVEVPRPKLLAARRLGSAIEQHEVALAFEVAAAPAVRDDCDAILDIEAEEHNGRASKTLLLEKPKNSLSKRPTVENLGDAASSAAAECPPLDAELTGMGMLPFVWYEGCVTDLELFGVVPLETDEVASAPDVSRLLTYPRRTIDNHDFLLLGPSGVIFLFWSSQTYLISFSYQWAGSCFSRFEKHPSSLSSCRIFFPRGCLRALSIPNTGLVSVCRFRLLKTR